MILQLIEVTCRACGGLGRIAPWTVDSTCDACGGLGTTVEVDPEPLTEYVAEWWDREPPEYQRDHCTIIIG